jgi:hypothetical protein
MFSNTFTKMCKKLYDIPGILLLLFESTWRAEYLSENQFYRSMVYLE